MPSMNEIIHHLNIFRSTRDVYLFIAFFFACALSLVVLVANNPVPGPMIQADEGSHLANAAAIAGFFNDMASSYHAGYSILIAPAFFISQGSDEIWFAVKVINASLFFILFMALYWVSYLIKPDISPWFRLSAVGTVSLYPMWVVMSGYAFSQIAMAPAFVIVFGILLSALAGKKWCWWALGPLAGFLYWIHPTGIVAGIAASIVAVFYGIYRRNYFSMFLVPLSFFLMILGYRYGFSPWLQNRMLSSGLSVSLHYPESLQLLKVLGSWAGLHEITTRLNGHLFYLTIGTIGIFWLGFYSLIRDSWFLSEFAERGDQIKLRFVTFFSVITVFGVLILSVLLFSSSPDANRLDHWMYGRYVEAFIAPILLIGLVNKSYKFLLWTIPAVFIFGLVLWIGIEPYTHVAKMNISAFWQDFYLQEKGIFSWIVSGAILIFFAALMPRKLATLLFICIFVFASYLQICWHVNSANNISYRLVAANDIKSLFPHGTCVGFDHSKIDSYNKSVYRFDYSFVLYNYGLQRMSYDHWWNNCDGPLFTYDFNHPEVGNQAFPVTISPRKGPIALIKKSALREGMFYPIIIEERHNILPLILKNGWHDLEQRHVWSGPVATLLLPSPYDCISEKCRAVITASVFGASPTTPHRVHVKANATFELEVKTSGRIEIEVPIGKCSLTAGEAKFRMQQLGE